MVLNMEIVKVKEERKEYKPNGTERTTCILECGCIITIEYNIILKNVNNQWMRCRKHRNANPNNILIQFPEQ